VPAVEIDPGHRDVVSADSELVERAYMAHTALRKPAGKLGDPSPQVGERSPQDPQPFPERDRLAEGRRCFRCFLQEIIRGGASSPQESWAAGGDANKKQRDR
jgi:hypothetical protein